MGRLATYIAGRASSADRLPGQFPNVSLFDALLPRIVTGSSRSRASKPLADREGSMRGSVTHTDVTKNKKGQLVLVQHRDKSVSLRSDGGRGASLEDVKKTADAAGDNAKSGDKDDKKKDGVVDENEFKFTAEEDSKLNKLKADEPTMKWTDVGEKLGRPAEEGKARFAELKRLAKGPSWDAKGDSKEDNSKKNESKQNDSKKDSGGNNNAKGGNWTPAEDALIEEMMSKGEKVQHIAAKLNGRVRKEVGQRMQELKMQQSHDAKKNGGDDKAKTDQKGKEGGGKKKENGDKEKSKQDSTPKKDDPKPKSPSIKAGSETPSKAPSKAPSSTRSEAKFTMGEWMTLQEDDMFSFRELQLLSELIIKDAKESCDGVYSWLRVASLLADRTGRRVHPEDIREKFEGMARD